MASTAALSIRRAQAMNALDAAKARLSKASGVKLDAPALKSKDPDIARIVLIEETAKLLDKVARAISSTSQPEPDPADKPPPVKQPAPPPATEPTVMAEPEKRGPGRPRKT